MKEIAVRLALVLMSLASTALLIEIGLRIFGGEPRTGAYVTTLGREKIRDPLPGVRYLYRAHASYTQVWPDNPRGYFDAGTHGIRYQVNNYGFRGEDFTLARTEAIRIAFLGDSLCWGNGVRDRDGLAVQVEQRLNESAPLGLTYEVYNFCLVGYGTEHEAALYDYVARHFRPDLLVVWYFLNDVNRSPPIYIKWRTGRRDQRSSSRFFDLLLTPINQHLANRELFESVDRAYEVEHPGLQAVEAGLQRIRRLSSADDVPSFLAILPWLYRLEAGRYPFDKAHRAVTELAERQGFQVLDLLSVLRNQRARDLWVHPLDHHLNEIGHALVGDAMADFLSAYLERAGEAVVSAAERRRLMALPAGLEETPGAEWYHSFVQLARTSSPAGG